MIAVMAITTMTASAQKTLRDNGSFTLQPKVGLAIGTFSGDYTKVADEDPKSRYGVIAGLEGEYYINDWLSAAAGISYAQQGWKFEGTGIDQTTKLDYLNVPLTANFYVSRGFALKTGVQFGFLMSAKQNSTDVKDDCKKLNVSVPIGLSYEFSNIVVDARYNISVTKANKYTNAFDDTSRSDLLQITLGYKFGL